MQSIYGVAPFPPTECNPEAPAAIQVTIHHNLKGPGINCPIKNSGEAKKIELISVMSGRLREGLPWHLRPKRHGKVYLFNEPA